MKQYMLAVHSVEGEPTPSDDQRQILFAQVDRVNAELQAAGAWVFAGGLQPADTATVVRVEAGAATLTDGPFAETKEQLGGYFVVDCESLDEAIEAAGKLPTARHGSIEVRPLVER